MSLLWSLGLMVILQKSKLFPVCLSYVGGGLSRAGGPDSVSLCGGSRELETWEGAHTAGFQTVEAGVHLKAPKKLDSPDVDGSSQGRPVADK